MNNIAALALSILLVVNPPPVFDCDGKLLTATIRNNLNGDFALVDDLEEIDEGAFVVLDWEEISLMLPVSFQKGEISFTDKKWLWSYKDNNAGLHIDKPRFSQRLQSGQIVEYSCDVSYNAS